MLYEISLGGKLQVDFLLTQDDNITNILDFMLGNHSPFALNKETLVKTNISVFEPLTDLVCYLIRHCLTN